jgi:hypothetical protein
MERLTNEAAIMNNLEVHDDHNHYLPSEQQQQQQQEHHDHHHHLDQHHDDDLKPRLHRSLPRVRAILEDESVR